MKSVIQRAIILGEEAYWNLDPSPLEDVFTEEALRILQDNIEQYSSSELRIDRISRDLKYIDISFTEQPLRAKVIFKRSLRVFSYSLQTGLCIESTPEYEQELTYNLQRQTHSWKIFAIERHSNPPRERLPCQ